ncbi:hypothetical protein [Streptomyces virginiae]|uniref:hypothetical protein n=1 Tax=Streptomyces virginiae TaxID=1961 RepID=UPI002255D9FE|nr:hypothetical protein [Streptomyces virginiae]MCX5174439.1 hypothetical protein [Streptomyces virginiae]
MRLGKDPAPLLLGLRQSRVATPVLDLLHRGLGDAVVPAQLPLVQRVLDLGLLRHQLPHVGQPLREDVQAGACRPCPAEAATK